MRPPSLTFSLCVLSALVLTGAFLFPWFRYSSTSGNLAPPGEEPVYERHHITIKPFTVDSSDPVTVQAQDAAQFLGIGLIITLAAVLALALLDFFFEDRESWRRPMLALVILAVLVAAGLLAWATVRLPEVTGAPGLMSHVRTPDKYETGEIRAGGFFLLAIFPALLAYLGLRYSSGSVEWRRPATTTR